MRPGLFKVDPGLNPTFGAIGELFHLIWRTPSIIRMQP